MTNWLDTTKAMDSPGHQEDSFSAQPFKVVIFKPDIENELYQDKFADKQRQLFDKMAEGDFIFDGCCTEIEYYKLHEIARDEVMQLRAEGKVDPLVHSIALIGMYVDNDLMECICQIYPDFNCISLHITVMSKDAFVTWLTRVVPRLIHLSLDNTVYVFPQVVPVSRHDTLSFQLKQVPNHKLLKSVFKESTKTSVLADLRLILFDMNLPFDYTCLSHLPTSLTFFYPKFVMSKDQLTSANGEPGHLQRLLKHLVKSVEYLRLDDPNEPGVQSLMALELLAKPEYKQLRGVNLTIDNTDISSDEFVSEYWAIYKDISDFLNSLETLTLVFNDPKESGTIIRLFARRGIWLPKKRKLVYDKPMASKHTLKRFRIKGAKLNLVTIECIRQYLNLKSLQLIDCTFESQNEMNDIVGAINAMPYLCHLIIENQVLPDDDNQENKNNGAPRLYMEHIVKLFQARHKWHEFRMNNVLSLVGQQKDSLKRLAKDKPCLKFEAKSDHNFKFIDHNWTD